MRDFRHARLFVGRLAGPTRPAAGLALATTLIFAIALALAWTIPSDAQVDCSGGGAGWCLFYPGTNPCSRLSSSCQPVGPGYTCTIAGNTNPTIEGTYKIQASPAAWPLCSFPATLSSMSCTASPYSCGATFHYVSGYNACSVSCTGNWYWEACWGSGNSC